MSLQRTPSPLPPARHTRSQKLPQSPFDPRAGKPPRTVKMAEAKLDVKTDATSQASSAGSSPATTCAITESSLTPAPFYGATDKAQKWLQYFQRYAAFKQLSENAALALFALLMRDTANTWFSSLPETVRNNYTQAVERFSTKFAPAPITLWRRASELWSRDQRQEESVEQYFSDMIRKAREVNATADMTRYALMKGLRQTYRSYVMQQNPTTVEQLLDAAKVAEATISDAEPMGTPEILEAINRLERRVSAPITDQRRVSFRRASKPPPRPASRDRRDPPTYGTGWSEPPRRPSAPQPGYGP